MTSSIKVSPEERRLSVRIARLYYQSDMTQKQIGDQLGLSRVKVGRILRLAREADIVEIRINGAEERAHVLEDALLSAYGLRDVVVVPDAPTPETQMDRLAEGAAAWLAGRLRPGLRLGLGLGRTIARLPDTFRLDKAVDCAFTEIEGAASNHLAGFSSYNITSRMAGIAGGRAEFIHAPTFVSDRALRDRLVEEPAIAQGLEQARKSDILIQSVGTVTESALLYVHGVLTRRHLDELRRMGAVGDALGHYFDARGSHLPYWTDDMHVGLTLEDLANVPMSALVAGGPEKVAAILGALRGGWFNVLITDKHTAPELIERHHA